MASPSPEDELCGAPSLYLPPVEVSPGTGITQLVSLLPCCRPPLSLHPFHIRCSGWELFVAEIVLLSVRSIPRPTPNPIQDRNLSARPYFFPLQSCLRDGGPIVPDAIKNTSQKDNPFPRECAGEAQ